MAAKQVAWFLFDVVLGLLLAGVAAPFALAVLPAELRGNLALVLLGLAAMLAASVLRRLVIDCR